MPFVESLWQPQLNEGLLEPVADRDKAEKGHCDSKHTVFDCILSCIEIINSCGRGVECIVEKRRKHDDELRGHPAGGGGFNTSEIGEILTT